jgi:branched-chain amino acid transport system substrate-binding protein
MSRQAVYKRAVLALVLGLVAWLGGACASQAPASTQPNEIRIGLLATLTGASADTSGKPTVEAAKLAVQRLNDAGGLEVGGRKLKVVLLIEDDQDKSAAAVDAARKLIAQQGAVVIVGPQFSRNAIPVADVVESAHVPMISPASTNPATTAGKRYVFRAAFIDPLQAQVLARFAREELHVQKVAVLYDIASAYNKGLAEQFKQAIESAGGQVVAFESYTTDAKRDLLNQLERVRASKPELLFLPNYADEVPYQAQQARRIGVTATLLGADSWGNLPSADRAKLDGSFYTGHWAGDIEGAQAQAFISAYQLAYGQAPGETAALTYDAFGLLFQAIQRQGQADPEAIRAGLAGTNNYAGVTGSMQYQGAGDPIRSIVILQIKGEQARFYKLVNP